MSEGLCGVKVNEVDIYNPEEAPFRSLIAFTPP